MLEAVEVPEEFLRDPSYWIKAEELEQFLVEVLRRSWSVPSSQLLTNMAQSCVETRSWGVLDSVMRMMNSPAEVFSQPERFLSYFIAPAPPVDRQVRSATGLSFDLPISSDQYPLLTRFMSASFEAIPMFMGRPPAHCEWQGIRLSLDWEAKQSEIFERESVERQLSPDLARDLLDNLRPANLETEVLNVTPTERSQPSEDFVTTPMISPGLEAFRAVSTMNEIMNSESRPDDLRPEFDRLRHHIARLSDYMIRAQQIITLMASAKKLSPEVKEAMRRVDWPIVQTQFPATVEECYQIFRQNRAAATSPPGPHLKSDIHSHDIQKEIPHV